MSRDDELRDVLDQTAEAFAQYDNNPSTWLTWIVYLLGRLQQQALDVNPMYQDIYNDMLANLRDSVRNRLKTGGW